MLSGLTCDKAPGQRRRRRRPRPRFVGVPHRRPGPQDGRRELPRRRLGRPDRRPAARRPDPPASLELGIEKFRGTGNCDSGYSCVYEHTLAWRNATTPLPTEVESQADLRPALRRPAQRPRPAEARPPAGQRARRRARRRPRRWRSKLGGADRQKLDQYLSSVRELEDRIHRAEKLPPVELPDGTQRPEQLPADLTEHFHLMCDLLVLAFQTDVTRIATFMFGREGSEQKYPMVGVNEGHHSITHHQNKPELLAKIAAINTFHIEQLAYLLGKLKAIKEGDGTLLDNCMIAYGSAIADGNRHDHDDLPVLLAGKGGGTIKTGRHVRYTRETPLNNLWLAMLDRFGCRTERLGDSTGILDKLA